MTFTITIGRYAGFYIKWGYVKRICLGWIAFDLHPYELDRLLGDWERMKKKEKES